MTDDQTEPEPDDDEVAVDDVDWAELARDQIRMVHRTRDNEAAVAVTYALLDIGQQLRRIADRHGVDPV